MNSRRQIRSRNPRGAFCTVLLLLSLLMAAGILLGYMMYGIFVGDDDGQLRAFILQYVRLLAEAEGKPAAPLSVILVYFRYPVLLFVCGCTALSAVLIPLLCAVQGFVLAFSVSCFAAQLGRSGLLLALCAFGPRCMLVIPCTLALATWLLILKRKKATQTHSPARTAEKSVFFKQLTWCLIILSAGVILELWLVPRLFALALTKLL